MQTVFRVVLTMMLVLSTSCISDPEEPVWSLAPGDRLPEFEVVAIDADGARRQVSTTSLSGRPGVIVLFSTGCADCRSELPVVNEAMLRAQAAGVDASWLCISRAEAEESVMAFWVEKKLSLPVSPQSDSEVYLKFASSIIPRIYVYDSEGIIRQVYTDSPMPDAEMLFHALQEVVGGKHP